MIKRIRLILPFQPSLAKSAKRRRAANEGGWALLSLILALTIISIVLTSSIQPNYQVSIQSEKEAELFYRGQQMAEGIAKYYNNNVLTSQTVINLGNPPSYGYLKDLKKLKEGVTINLREIKFVRPSAMIDPFDGEQWEPVYARDPRIMPFLQAWALETGGIISQYWLQIAGPPPKMQLVQKPVGSLSGTPSGTTGAGSSSGSSSTSGGTNPPQNTTAPGQPRGNQNTDLDDDDDDDDDANDPLSHLFTGGNGQLPIVGVAPRRKGRSIRAFYGLNNYEEWIFIYIPTVNRINIPNQQNQGTGQQQLRINQ